jgi:hypothetical protein
MGAKSNKEATKLKHQEIANIRCYLCGHSTLLREALAMEEMKNEKIGIGEGFDTCEGAPGHA